MLLFFVIVIIEGCGGIFVLKFGYCVVGLLNVVFGFIFGCWIVMNNDVLLGVKVGLYILVFCG